MNTELKSNAAAFPDKRKKTKNPAHAAVPKKCGRSGIPCGERITRAASEKHRCGKELKNAASTQQGCGKVTNRIGRKNRRN